MLVVSTNKEAGLRLGLGVRADEVEGEEAQVRGRPMLMKKRRSRVESFMLRKSASGAGEPVDRVAQIFIAHEASNRFDWRKILSANSMPRRS